MSSTRTSSFRKASLDHFEPQDDADPQTQRRLRGQLEQIDYTAYVCNREVIGAALGVADIDRFHRLALAAAHARAQWVALALSMTEQSQRLRLEQGEQLAMARTAYEELTEAYEALRRMVERGYLTVGAVKP